MCLLFSKKLYFCAQLKHIFMKNLILMFGLSFVLLSCGKDDEEPVTCTVADFVGVWTITGGEACILTDANTLTITDAGDGKIKPVYSGGGVTSQYDNWTVNGCGISGKITDSDFGIDITVTGTLSNGKLTIKNKGTVFLFPVDCTENLTK